MSDTEKKMNELGRKLYGNKWDSVLAHNLKRMTRDEREPDDQDYDSLLRGLTILAANRS